MNILRDFFGDGFNNSLNASQFFVTVLTLVLIAIPICLLLRNLVFKKRDQFSIKSWLVILGIVILGTSILNIGYQIEKDKRIETYDYLTSHNFFYYNSDAVKYLEKDIEKYDVKFKTQIGNVILQKRVSNMIVFKCNNIRFYYDIPFNEQEIFNSDPVSYLKEKIESN